MGLRGTTFHQSSAARCSGDRVYSCDPNRVDDEALCTVPEQGETGYGSQFQLLVEGLFVLTMMQWVFIASTSERGHTMEDIRIFVMVEMQIWIKSGYSAY